MRKRVLLASLLLLIFAVSAFSIGLTGDNCVKTAAGGWQKMFTIHYMPGMARLESGAGDDRAVNIIRTDKKVRWQLDARTKTYKEGSAELSIFDQSIVKMANARKTVVGDESVSGILCDKIRVVTSQNASANFIWKAKHFDIVPVRMILNGSGKSTVMELRNVTFGPQDPSLFEIPEGYKKAD